MVTLAIYLTQPWRTVFSTEVDGKDKSFILTLKKSPKTGEVSLIITRYVAPIDLSDNTYIPARYLPDFIEAFDKVREFMSGKELTTSQLRQSSKQLAESYPINQAKQDKVTKASIPKRPLSDAELNLFNRLRELRLRLAQSENVPSFIIASNSVLEALAKLRPLDIVGLTMIPGIGTRKATKYGEAFLEILRETA